MKLTYSEITDSLASMTVLVDTREQATQRLADRLEIMGLPYERVALNVGDYSCKCVLPDGSGFDFSTKVAIDRKMNIDEMCNCFTWDRGRFQREFERAQEMGAKLYLLVEDANWEKIYNGKYRSHMSPNALVASINTFRARYNMQLDFCKSETTGKVIKDILYRELKECLENMEVMKT